MLMRSSTTAGPDQARIRPELRVHDGLISLHGSGRGSDEGGRISKGLCPRRAAYKTKPFNCHRGFHALCVTAINPASAHACPHIFTPSEKPPPRTALAVLVKQLPPGYVHGSAGADEDAGRGCSSSSASAAGRRCGIKDAWLGAPLRSRGPRRAPHVHAMELFHAAYAICSHRINQFVESISSTRGRDEAEQLLMIEFSGDKGRV